jgi:hypothetical protein
MTTRLEGPLKRELLIGRQQFTLTVTPTGFLLALKGRRKGVELRWADLVSGDAALATALNASLGVIPPPGKTSEAPAIAARSPRKVRGGKARPGK